MQRPKLIQNLNSYRDRISLRDRNFLRSQNYSRVRNFLRDRNFFRDRNFSRNRNLLQGRNFFKGQNCFRNFRLHCNQTLIQSWNSSHCDRIAVYKVTRYNATFSQETSSEELTSVPRNINRSTKKKHSSTTSCISKHFSESDPTFLLFYSKFSVNSSLLKFFLLCQYNLEFYSIFILKYSNSLYIQTKIYKCIVNHDITLPPPSPTVQL